MKLVSIMIMSLFASAAFAQNSTIYITQDVSAQYAEPIYVLNPPRIVEKYQDKFGIPHMVVEFNGIMEGNLCSHNEVSLVRRSVDDRVKNNMFRHYEYSRQIYSFPSNRDFRGEKGIRAGGACASFSRHSPFRLRFDYAPLYLSDEDRPVVWHIQFLMDPFEKKLSPSIFISYSKKMGWKIKAFKKPFKNSPW